MGNKTAKLLGLNKAPWTPEQSAALIIDVVRMRQEINAGAIVVINCSNRSIKLVVRLRLESSSMPSREEKLHGDI